MPKVKHFISAYVKSPELKGFLEQLYTSTSTNEQLLCMCLLIELKYQLVDEHVLVDRINDLKLAGQPLDFTNFTLNRPIHFSNEYKGTKITYSRVVDKRTFDNYIGSFKFKRPFVEGAKIAMNGWSTRNGIVWVTPKSEIAEIWSIAKKQRETANMICDHLGFPRDMQDQYYYRIDYSPDFPEKIFQPNSSNRLWHYPYNLYLSIMDLDCFGLTYNENKVTPAREQVHSRSHFFDNKFTAEYLGRATKKMPVNERIIEMAKERLAP